MVGNRKAGHALWAAMTVIFIASLSVALWAEFKPNPAMRRQRSRAKCGQEVRIETANSVPPGAWPARLTSNGFRLKQHAYDSFRPLAGLMAMNNIPLQEKSSMAA